MPTEVQAESMPGRTREEDALLARVNRVICDLDLTPDDIGEIAQGLKKELNQALHTGQSSQIPSFVSCVPAGSELGTYLAVDLGGTNCRVSLVHLKGDSTFSMRQTKCTIPKSHMVNASHVPLFDFIAENIARLLADDETHRTDSTSARNDANAAPEILKLGFTFSFTFANQTLGSGTMLQWDKADAVGRDPVQMLQEAIDRLSLPVDVVAIISDSVGSLMARSYTSSIASDTLLAAIFGTGTNAAYFEHRANIHKVPLAPAERKDGVMIMNTEWGAWADSGHNALKFQTAYDRTLDQQSSNPGKQLLEKCISGLYLGEVVRLIIVEILGHGLFTMRPAGPFSAVYNPYAVDTILLSHLASDQEEGLSLSREAIAEHFGVSNVSYSDACAVRSIAAGVVKRSAFLAGAAMGAIILQSGRLPTSYLEFPCKDSTTLGMQEMHEHDSQGLKQSDMQIKNQRLTCVIGGILGNVAHTICALFGRPFPFLWTGMLAPRRPPLPAKLKTQKSIDIGIEGSLAEAYPGFEDHLRKALRDVPGIGVDGESCINIGVSRDGPILGAALAAHSAAVSE
ncbi:glucokinase [Penicillium chermesinum]|uniref:Phosphotransferase n=1 Tax=Penicillium chermesinum TaxID=63820 RepID=A0A9W9N837_9EURO|nr:glucokinase [Penicillium chermesinum]KAJ5215009.1 glucokinase [Penicillium chermesinum]